MMVEDIAGWSVTITEVENLCCWQGWSHPARFLQHWDNLTCVEGGQCDTVSPVSPDDCHKTAQNIAQEIEECLFSFWWKLEGYDQLRD